MTTTPGAAIYQTLVDSLPLPPRTVTRGDATTAAGTPYKATGTPARPDTLFDMEKPSWGRPGASGGNLGDAYWLAFSRDHDAGDAVAVFQRRYGRPPANVLPGLGGLLLVGPVPAEVLP